MTEGPSPSSSGKNEAPPPFKHLTFSIIQHHDVLIPYEPVENQQLIWTETSASSVPEEHHGSCSLIKVFKKL